MFRKSHIYFLIIILLLLSACGGGGDTKAPTTPTNKPPVVDAGVDQTMDEQSLVLLTASASDADGSIVSYQWTQTSGISVSLENAASLNASFTAPIVSQLEILTFELSVTDNEQKQSKDIVEISVFPKIPKLIVGTNITAKSGAHTLIEWQVESDHEIASASLEQVTGNLNIKTTVLDNNKAYFNAPVVGSENSEYQFRLTVTDIEGSSVAKNINLTTTAVASIFKDKKSIFELKNTGLDLDNMTIADIDNDGNTDFITYLNGKLYWFKNNGEKDGELDVDFTFRLINPDFDLYYSFFKKHRFEDLDGDNLPDLIAYQYFGQTDIERVVFSENLGNGEFSDVQELFSYQRAGYIYSPKYILQAFELSGYKQKVMAYYNNHEINVLASDGDSYKLGTHFKIKDITTDDNWGIEAIEYCDLENSGQDKLYIQTYKGDTAGHPDYRDGTSNLYVFNSDDDTILKLDSTDEIYPKILCLSRDKLSDQLLSITYETIKKADFDEETESYQLLDITNEFSFGADNSYITELEPRNSPKVIDLNLDGLDDIVVTERSAMLRDNESELTFLEKFGPSNYAFWWSGPVYWHASQENRFYTFSDNEISLWAPANEKRYEVHFPSKALVTGLKQVGPYYIITMNNSDGIVSKRAMQWGGEQLVEVQNVDPVYFIEGLRLFDFNGDAIDDALYTSIISVEGCYYFEVANIRYGNGISFDEEKQLTGLGCHEGDDMAVGMTNIKDINDDGFLDYVRSYISHYAYASSYDWRVYDAELQAYTDWEYSKSYFYHVLDIQITPSFWDVNGDSQTDIIQFNQLYQCNSYTICGTLQYRLKQADNLYDEWKSFDENLIDVKVGHYRRDIDQDGIDDVILGTLNDRYWLKRSNSGTYASNLLITDLPNYYADLFGIQQPYFYNIDSGRFVLYSYNESLKSPVIVEVQPLESISSYKRFIDIDDDLDLDILFVEDNHIMMSENTHHQ